MPDFVARERRAKQTASDRFIEHGGVITICLEPDGKIAAIASLNGRDIKSRAGNMIYAVDNLRRMLAFEERRYQNVVHG